MERVVKEQLPSYPLWFRSCHFCLWSIDKTHLQEGLEYMVPAQAVDSQQQLSIMEEGA